MTDHNQIHEYIKDTAKLAASEVATQLREEMAQAAQRVTRLEVTVGVNAEGTPTGNGLKGQVDRLDHRSAACKIECDKALSELKQVASGGNKTVKAWRERLQGAAIALSTAGVIILGILEVHKFLK